MAGPSARAVRSLANFGGPRGVWSLQKAAERGGSCLGTWQWGGAKLIAFLAGGIGRRDLRAHPRGPPSFLQGLEWVESGAGWQGGGGGGGGGTANEGLVFASSQAWGLIPHGSECCQQVGVIGITAL